MVHLNLLALAAFMASIAVEAHRKSWKAHKHLQQCRVNESTVIGYRQRLQKPSNAIINNVSAMRPGLAKIIEKVCIVRYVERAETDLHIAEIACCIGYTDTQSSKEVD
jgi:hypothetical protein